MRRLDPPGSGSHGAGATPTASGAMATPTGQQGIEAPHQHLAAAITPMTGARVAGTPHMLVAPPCKPPPSMARRLVAKLLPLAGGGRGGAVAAVARAAPPAAAPSASNSSGVNAGPMRSRNGSDGSTASLSMVRDQSSARPPTQARPPKPPYHTVSGATPAAPVPLWAPTSHGRGPVRLARSGVVGGSLSDSNGSGGMLLQQAGPLTAALPGLSRPHGARQGYSLPARRGTDDGSGREWAGAEGPRYMMSAAASNSGDAWGSSGVQSAGAAAPPSGASAQPVASHSSSARWHSATSSAASCPASAAAPPAAYGLPPVPVTTGLLAAAEAALERGHAQLAREEHRYASYTVLLQRSPPGATARAPYIVPASAGFLEEGEGSCGGGPLDVTAILQAPMPWDTHPGQDTYSAPSAAVPPTASSAAATRPPLPSGRRIHLIGLLAARLQSRRAARALASSAAGDVEEAVIAGVEQPADVDEAAHAMAAGVYAQAPPAVAAFSAVSSAADQPSSDTLHSCCASWSPRQAAAMAAAHMPQRTITTAGPCIGVPLPGLALAEAAGSACGVPDDHIALLQRAFVRGVAATAGAVGGSSIQGPVAPEASAWADTPTPFGGLPGIADAPCGGDGYSAAATPPLVAATAAYHLPTHLVDPTPFATPAFKPACGPGEESGAPPEPSLSEGAWSAGSSYGAGQLPAAQRRLNFNA